MVILVQVSPLSLSELLRQLAMYSAVSRSFFFLPRGLGRRLQVLLAERVAVGCCVITLQRSPLRVLLEEAHSLGVLHGICQSAFLQIDPWGNRIVLTFWSSVVKRW